MILNGKENKEASTICFEIRIPKKKNEELFRKVPSKIYEIILLWKKMKKKICFVNISEYYHRTMGLMPMKSHWLILSGDQLFQWKHENYNRLGTLIFQITTNLLNHEINSILDSIDRNFATQMTLWLTLLLRSFK